MAQLNRIEHQEMYKEIYANSDWVVFKALGSRDVAFAIKLDALPMACGQSLLVNAKYLCVIGGVRKDMYQEVADDPNSIGPFGYHQTIHAPIDFNY
ncbi:hypothetical protein [Aeromonas hydrophila]|uniref:hypothetical protein n=1 Tax=Aeromonas hydrophila TaxID=644 RepID=UPI0030D1BB68